MGLVFGNAVCDQFFGSHKPGFFQIPRNFFPLGLFRGERRGKPLDFLHTKGDGRRDFFLRVGMVEEGLQKPSDFLAPGRVMELSCNGFYCLRVGIPIAQPGAVKLANKMQHLGCQLGIGVCGFFFFRWFLHFGRHSEHRRVLGGGDGHFRGVGNPLNLIPHRLRHFLVIKLHGAVGGDMGHGFVVPMFFLQTVPDGEAVPQVAIAQVIGFGRGHGGGRRFLVFCKEGKRALPEGGEVFKACFPPFIHPVVLRGGFPHRHHHLVDFLHAGRVVKLRLDELHRVPIVKAKRIGVRLLLGYVLKESADVPGKLVFLILRHGGPVFLG